MFGAYVYEKSSAEYEKHVLLIDEDGLEEKTGYSAYFIEQGFQAIRYENDLVYRVKVEDRVRSGQEKLLMIADAGVYIPYDALKTFRTTKIGIYQLFPKLNAKAVKDAEGLDYNLLAMAYQKNFSDLNGYKQTKDFLRDQVFAKENVRLYLDMLCDKIEAKVQRAATYRDWFAVAKQKAEILVLAEQYGISIDIEELFHPFLAFVQKDFGRLSSEMAEDTPVLVSRAME